MTKRELIRFDEKYFTSLTVLITLTIATIYRKSFCISDWIGANTIPIMIAIVTMPFILTAKGIIMSLNIREYEGLKKLNQSNIRRKKFYEYMDKTIYASLLIIIINIIYLLGKNIINAEILEYSPIVIIVSISYLLSAIKRVLQCIHTLQTLSFAKLPPSQPQQGS